ncbi:PTS fructose transporter subunit IIABC [Candidatus Stoquefichus massiliensis]|uniref:PTS fructose transporter subunit IIABC n=1 Tax=Candidatus Stoquefichus massiliensis TaxID=1470350 RepID=UPI00048A10CE|nr:fructose-specific PTS transporter subunit EIIC [Candidatus Stoquefichus massiliensis]
MNINDLLKEDSILLHSHYSNKQEVLDAMIECHYKNGHIKNKDKYKDAILARENLSSTGVGQMIAIPHAQDETVNYPSLVAMVDQEGVNFDSLDQLPAKVFFMIAVPKDGGSQHLEILAQLSQILMDETTVHKLLNAQTPHDFLNILTGKMEEEIKDEIEDSYDVLAVTACPTGIAHTYMAAKSLEETAKQLGIKIKVETNGASGIKNILTEEEIQKAKSIIIAADKKVEMKRFANKKLIQVPVAKGIHNAKEILEQAMSDEEIILENNVSSSKGVNFNFIKTLYNHLMNGVSQVIPILMIYGILKTVLEWIGKGDPNTYYNGVVEMSFQISYLKDISMIIYLIIGFGIIPIMSAFIADSIGDKPAFVVAFVASLSCINYSHIMVSFILIGFISGYLVLGLKKLFSYLPNVIESIIPNLLIPLSGTLIMILLLQFVNQSEFNPVVIMSELVLNEITLIVIGLIIGIMMSIDMGGPINKTAYFIGIMSIILGKYQIMSAAMIGGMVPPIAIGLAMLIYPKAFNEKEQKEKWKCMIKGLCFVSEEAIPYMSKDRKGIHLPCIIASGIAGALVMYYGCGQLFPHGGIFTVIFINNPIHFIIALLSSTIIGACLIIMFKKTS